MKLSTNSWHRKFRDTVFDEYQHPKSICHYFWELVFVTTFVITFPVVYFWSLYTHIRASDNRIDKISNLILYTCALILFTFLSGTFFLTLYCAITGVPEEMLSYYFTPLNLLLGNWASQLSIVITLFVFGFIGKSVYFLSTMIMDKVHECRRQKRVESKPPKSKSFSIKNTIVWNYLKALKDKTCPLIEWESDTQN